MRSPSPHNTPQRHDATVRRYHFTYKDNSPFQQVVPWRLSEVVWKAASRIPFFFSESMLGMRTTRRAGKSAGFACLTLDLESCPRTLHGTWSSSPCSLYINLSRTREPKGATGVRVHAASLWPAHMCCNPYVGWSCHLKDGHGSSCSISIELSLYYTSMPFTII